MVVEALIGKLRGDDTTPPEVIRDIEREVWETQKRIEIQNAFQAGLEFFRIRVFERALQRFSRVVQIIDSEFPEDEEFAPRKALAKRYLNLARREIRRKEKGETKEGDAPVVTRVWLITFEEGELRKVFQKVQASFHPARSLPGSSTNAVWAALDPIQGDLLLETSLRHGSVLPARNASFILENGVRETFEKLVKIPYRGLGKKTGSAREKHPVRDVHLGLRLEIDPWFEPRGENLLLDVTVSSTFPGSPSVRVQGSGGVTQIPIVFHQAFRVRTRVYRGHNLVFLGLKDPFTKAQAGSKISPPSRDLLVLLRPELK
jgi:hypothetical protein